MKNILFILITFPVCSADISSIKYDPILLTFDTEKTVLEFDRRVLEPSKVLQTLLADLSKDTTPLRIPSLSSHTFIHLYSLMGLISNGQANKNRQNIKDCLSLFDFNKTKNLLVAVNYLDIPDLLQPTADRFSELLVRDDQLQKFVQQPLSFISSLQLPKELTDLVADSVMETPNLKRHLRHIILDTSQIIDVGANNFGGVNSITFHPDGTLIAMINSCCLELWDLENNKKLSQCEWISYRSTSSITFSPNGSKLFCSSLHDIFEYSLEGSPRHLFIQKKLWNHSQNISSLAITSDSSQLASASLDTSVKIWCLKTYRPIKTLSHATGITSIAISSDISKLACGSNKGIITVWNMKNWQSLATISAHPHEITKLQFSRDNLLISGCDFLENHEKITKIWEAKTLRKLDELKGCFQTASAIGSKLALFDRNIPQVLIVWDENQNSKSFYCDASCCFSPDGSMLATSNGKTIKLWNLHMKKLPLELCLLFLTAKMPKLASPENNLLDLADLANRTFSQVQNLSTRKKIIDYLKPILEYELRNNRLNKLAQKLLTK